MIVVTYLHHSGFLVETDGYCLLFDYYTQNGRYGLTITEEQKAKKWLVFASHAHHDHFDEKIFSLWNQGVSPDFVLSWDIPPYRSHTGGRLTVHPHKEYEWEGVSIKTLASNDEGVAFLVEADGSKIYHAGDLNWWHWNGESEAFNSDIAKSYCTEIDQLKGLSIDVAMVPVDLRLQDKYIWGLDYFMRQTNTKWVFPMHFWRRFEVCQKIQQDKLAESYKNRVMSIGKASERFVLST